MSYTIETYREQNGDTLALVMDGPVVVASAIEPEPEEAVLRARQNAVLRQSGYTGFTAEEEAELLSAPVVVAHPESYAEVRMQTLVRVAA